MCTGLSIIFCGFENFLSNFFFLEFNISIYIFIYLYFCDENLSQVLCYYLVTNGELETFWGFNRGLLSNKCKTLNFLNCNTPRLNSLLNLAPIIQHSLRLFQSNCPLKFQKVEKITSFFLVTYQETSFYANKAKFNILRIP